MVSFELRKEKEKDVFSSCHERGPWLDFKKKSIFQMQAVCNSVAI